MELDKTSQVRWLSHDADILLEVRARSLEELFRAAAVALVGSMVDTRTVTREDRRTVRVEGTDRESLLVAWLNEIIYLVSEGVFFPAAIGSLRIERTSLEADLHGECATPADERLQREVKAATYHDLQVSRAAGGWETRVLFDV
jgi:SHS2 domain-containing protein